ncbi:hypothetical protein LIER_13759 [Lithospermum erythrorhizon]|uniref:Zinc-ribbon domain-containing protein n=1 Tax=Lithospermum erythrorhizon TaxID=34254 RepID=A0AAV3PWK5_LITER
MNSEFRLVKCPKCLKILAELPNIPVYKCGGCGAILQAKKKKNDIKQNELKVQETGPSEPNSASSSSSPGGDHHHFEEFSPGSDTREEQFERGSHKSVKPSDTNSSNDDSHSTQLNLQDDKLSPEKNESAVQGERERLLDQDAGQRESESLNNSNQKLHDRISDVLSDSCDSYYENEDSSTEISISEKKYEEGHSPKLNVVTSVNEIEDSNGVLEEEEDKCSGEPKSLDQDKAHFLVSKNQMAVEKERETIGAYTTNEIEGSLGVLAKEERFSGERQSLDDPKTTCSRKCEPVKLVVAKEQENNGNEIGKYTNDIEDSKSELSQEEKHSSGRQSFDEPMTHFSVNEPLKLDEEKEPSSEDEEDIKVDIRYLSKENDKMGQNAFPNQVVEHSQRRETETETSSFSIKDFHKAEATLLVAKEYSVADENRSHLETPPVGPEKGKDLIPSQGPMSKSILFPPLSPDDEYLMEFRQVGQSLHHISSEEMLDTSPFDPRVPIGSMSKSPTKIYYDGDRSESSYDRDEGLSEQVSHSYSRKFKGTRTASTHRSHQKAGFRVKNKQNGKLQMHYERSDLLSKFKQPHIFTGAEQDGWHQESPEPRKHSHPFRNSMIAADSEPIARGSYMPRSTQLLHENGSPAISTDNVFLPNRAFHRSDIMLASDQEKNELLRMIYELKDKINHTHMPKQMLGENLHFRDVGEEIRTGGYYDGPTMGRNSHVDFKYSGHQRSQPQGVGWANQPRNPRLAFSGEASLCRNHIDCRCSDCYHQDLHYSRKLSSHCIHCQHEIHHRHEYENVYHSYSPSQQHYTSSEISHEIQADNKKQDHEVKMSYLREKHQAMKRHLRPFCGGAPIINCYRCSELLQLPADFILFRRRCHQLKCNSCNRVLKFSLLENSHLVPYVNKIRTPPPSGMDNYSNLVHGRTPTSTSHVNDPQAAGPVSFSDDFEPSLSRNGSSESGPSVPSSHSLLKNLPNGKQPSNQTFQAMNYRRMETFMEIYQDTNKNSRFNIEAAGPSSSTSRWVKPSSEIEELPATSGSPLHRLMGYDSPRQMLFAKSEDESDDGMGYYMDQKIR